MGYLTKEQIAAIIAESERRRAACREARERLEAAYGTQPPAQPTTATK